MRRAGRRLSLATFRRAAPAAAAPWMDAGGGAGVVEHPLHLLLLIEIYDSRAYDILFTIKGSLVYYLRFKDFFLIMI